MKTFTVATTIQKALLEKVLINEITVGFWKNVKPANHAEVWQDVIIEVGTELGAKGFTVQRNYNLLNPTYFNTAEKMLLDIAKQEDPTFTSRQLKQQLIMLNQILGSRLTSANGTLTKLDRVKKVVSKTSIQTSKKSKSVVVRKALAIIEDVVMA